MTIKTQTARHVIVANGTTTRFDFTFQVQDPADLYVGLEQTVISTGFTVVLNPDQATTPGGYVDFVTAPLNGQRVTMFRWTIFTQEMFYSAYDPFPAKSHERALDTLAMQIQQIEDQVQRSYKVPWWVTDEEIPPPGGNVGGDLSFPPPSPGDTLVWNPAGTGFDNAPGESDFLSWVNRAETGAVDAEYAALQAQSAATSATGSAGQAANSATNASNSAVAADASATKAKTSETNAKTSENAALASKNAAALSETNAKTSETNAAQSAAASLTYAGQSEASAANSAASAAASLTSANNADASAVLASKWADSLVEVVPSRYSAMHWADVAAGLVGGAVHEITSSDIEMLTVSVPQSGYRLLTLHSNVPLGVVKLTSAGVIPPEQLPASGINLLGPFRGDDLCPKLNDPVGACTEPDYRNPSERWPTYVFHTGNSFIIIMEATQSSGHINAIDPATEAYGVMEVFAGDGLIFFEQDVLDPADGVTVVIKAGWHVQPGWVKGGAVLAVNVMYDNTYSDWVGGNVQSVLDEVSGRAALLDRVNTFTADQYFDSNIHLNVANAIWAFDGIRDERILYAIGPGNLGLGVNTLNLISLITADGGLLHHKTATADYIIWDAQNLVNPAALGVANTWTAKQTFTGGMAVTTVIESLAANTGGYMIQALEDTLRYGLFVDYALDASRISLVAHNTEGITLTRLGSVGIGTTTPGSYKLLVNGETLLTSQLTLDGFLGGAGISFRQGFSPLNVGVRAKDVAGTTSRDGLEILGYNGIDLTTQEGAYVALRVKADGNVGIGTTAPGAKLDVGVTAPTVTIDEGADMRGIRLVDTGAGLDAKTGVWANLGTLNAGMVMGRSGANWGTYVAFHTHGDATSNLDGLIERMRVTPDGNVGIGVTNPFYALETQGTFAKRVLAYGTSATPVWESVLVYGNSADGDGGGAGIQFSNEWASTYGSGIALRTMPRGSATRLTRLLVDPDGNVGIGTTGPTEKLDIQDAAGCRLKLRNTVGGYIQAEVSANASSVATLSFSNSLTLTGGNVGIGTTAPQYTLDVNGSINASSLYINGAAISPFSPGTSYTWTAHQAFNAGMALGGAAITGVSQAGGTGDYAAAQGWVTAQGFATQAWTSANFAPIGGGGALAASLTLTYQGGTAPTSANDFTYNPNGWTCQGLHESTGVWNLSVHGPGYSITGYTYMICSNGGLMGGGIVSIGVSTSLTLVKMYNYSGTSLFNPASGAKVTILIFKNT